MALIAKKKRGATRVKLVRPRPVDAHVGARVRLRRNMLGMSQEKLAAALGLTFQQVQKYERGTNRISSSKLYDMSKIMDVPIQFFFDEMPSEIAATAREPNKGFQLAAFEAKLGDMTKTETIKLVRVYYRIKSPRIRRKVLDLAKTLGRADA